MMRSALVMGEAGVGKTTWLIAKAREYAGESIKQPQQKILGLTFMHGARRRLEAKLRDSCQPIPLAVRTIDSFALSIVNRWRGALGFRRVLRGGRKELALTPAEDHLGVRLHFDQILEFATTLLGKATVGRIIGFSYPLVVIDEFQDCYGSRLEFVKALAGLSCVLLGADDFQFLADELPGCPAVEWAQQTFGNSQGELHVLTGCQRTSNSSLTEAAKCLRYNLSAPATTVPVICCPNDAPLAYKIIESLFFRSKVELSRETCAIISPSHDPMLKRVLQSFASQLAKRHLGPVQWHEEISPEEESNLICAELGLIETDVIDVADFNLEKPGLSPLARLVATSLNRFARLRGLARVDRQLIVDFAEKTVHDARSFGPRRFNRVVTTVHGAKNQEFDHVFVVWPYRIQPSIELRRRLLYNAVTRARKTCTILVLGDLDRAKKDPVLSLLGPAQPCFGKSSSVRRVRKRKK